MLMKKTRKEHKEKYLWPKQHASMCCLGMCLTLIPLPIPSPCAVHLFGMVCPQTTCIYMLLEPCALSSSSYPISLLPISTPQAVACSGSWGCCGAVVGVVVAIIVMVIALL